MYLPALRFPIVSHSDDIARAMESLKSLPASTAHLEIDRRRHDNLESGPFAHLETQVEVAISELSPWRLRDKENAIEVVRHSNTPLLQTLLHSEVPPRVVNGSFGDTANGSLSSSLTRHLTSAAAAPAAVTGAQPVTYAPTELCALSPITSGEWL